MRAALSIAVALVLAGTTARAQTPEPFSESVIELQVNEEAAPVTVVARFDSDGAVLLRESDLKRLRLRRPAKGGISVDGVRYYRYGPENGASLALDPSTQSARLTLPATAFVGTELGLQRKKSPKPSTSTGAFLNYEVFSQQSGGDRRHGGLAETGLFASLGVLTSTTALRSDDERRGALRLETTFTRDFTDRLATLRLGDAISAPGAWGRAVRFAGLQFGTNFATQPTLVTTPFVTASGEAIVPSTADVFVNGRQVASEELPPGPFSFEGIPTLNGAGEVQVVVTDALGRQQVIAQPYYTGPSLLRAGLSQYSFEMGAIREDYGQRSNRYGPLVAAATYRHGFSDAWTAEVHAEGQYSGPVALGLDTALRLGVLGVLTATAAVGGEGSDPGWLGGFGFERSARRLSVFLRTQYASESFAQLGSTSSFYRFRQNSFGGVGLNLARYGNLQFAYALRSFWTQPQVESYGLSYSVSLGDYGFLNLSANHLRAEENSTDALLYWTLPVGDRRTASTGLRYQPGREQGEELEAVATLQKSTPAGTGGGYLASISSTADAEFGASYRTPVGQVEAAYARRNDEDGWRGSWMGGVAVTGAGVMPARWLDRSFAIVDVADFEGMTVYADNQPIGRTDSKGRVLLDNLRAYEANPISIDPLELPLEARIQKTSIDVTPGYRSGTVLRFPVDRRSSAILRLRLPDGSAVPAGASVTLAGGSWPVALDGLLYVEGIERQASGVASWRNGNCRFQIELPENAGPAPDLGAVRCTPGIE